MVRHLSTILCSLALLLSASIVHAATLSPSVLEIGGERGQTIESSFSILNTGVSEQEYFLDTIAFEPKDESGSPQFFSSEDETSASHWIKFEYDRIIVPAFSKVDVPFKIIVPEDSLPGGYYCAMTVSTTPADIVESNGAVVEAKTATLILLTVEGEVTQKLELLDFHFKQESHSLPFGAFTYRIQNQGDIHALPDGDIVLQNIFGQTFAILDANETDGRVLPSSTRAFIVISDVNDLTFLEKAGYQLSHLAMGPVTAKLNLLYGGSQSISASVSFWIVPWELITTVFTLLIFITLLGRKLKTKNK